MASNSNFLIYYTLSCYIVKIMIIIYFVKNDVYLVFNICPCLFMDNHAYYGEMDRIWLEEENDAISFDT